MGCGGSKTEPSSPRRKSQTGANGAAGGGYGGGKANTRGGKGRNKINNNDDDAYNEKRVRENLRHAAAGEDIEQLEKSMEIFINNRLQDGGDLTEAQRRLDFLQTRKYIRDACMRQHPAVLDKAIQRVESSPYRRQLKPYLDRAYYLKQHQEELDTFRHDILNMEQSTISEIRSYNHPNGAVHCTMAATYLCLGYPESHLLEWNNIQHLMGRYGKESLLNEVSRADTEDLDEESTVKAKKWLNKNTLDQVKTESMAAACFHVWDWVEVTALMGRYGKDSLIREISLADTKKLDKQTAALARSYLNQYSFEEVRSVSNGAAVFYLWASKMVGKYEGDKKGSTAGQPQPKQLTNSRRGNTPTNTEHNQGQFKAKPAPAGQSVRDSSQYQNQKQTKTQQNQAKQAQKTASKQSPQTSAKTAQRNVKDTKTQAKSQANNVSSKAKKDTNSTWGSSAPRKAW